jgi:hypothetical protein
MSSNDRLTLAVVLFFALAAVAQQAGNTAANVQVVPPLIQFSGIAQEESGAPFTGTVRMTFVLYATKDGGEPLWTETQDVPLDGLSHYSVQLGISRPDGVPAALFTTGESRWLGVRIAGQAEQPRILLVSVPYALKAGDAATLGGLPASAFVLAAPAGISTTDA